NVSHPCQGLADLQTIAEHRDLPGTRVAYVGDGNNVAHSLMLGCAMSGMHIAIATPEGHEPDESIVATATEIAGRNGGSVSVVRDPADAVKGSDVVYADVWTSMGAESAGENAFDGYQIDSAMFAQANPDAIFMHCLPAHRGEEVTNEVLEHERSFVFDQAENRLHAVKALMLFLADAE
ncbi:MAG: ornithine carbamoyltransferase, partial [bacterium]|nr:ornithine carbamoyltransferase [bacterium]